MSRMHPRECDSGLKSREIQAHVTAWMDLENILQSEMSQIQKDKYCMVLHTRGTQSDRIHRDEKWGRGCHGGGGGGMGSWCSRRTEFGLGKMKHSGDGCCCWWYNNGNALMTLVKVVNFTLCIFYHTHKPFGVQ